jgi:2-dehydro-3-deoxy-D-gluconate 5-dehydrogenase
MADLWLLDLTGRVAVVTGGDGEIGRGVALALAKAGTSVAIFSRNPGRNDRVLADLKAIGRPAVAAVVDVTNRDGLAPAVAAAEAASGPVGILGNHAGIANARRSGSMVDTRSV